MFSSSTSMRYIDAQLREYIIYKLAELSSSCVITTSQRPVRCFVGIHPLELAKSVDEAGAMEAHHLLNHMRA